jgi:hypothetical protein
VAVAYFDIEFEQFQGFFADGILTNFVALKQKSKKKKKIKLIFFFLLKILLVLPGEVPIFFDPNRKSRNRIYAPKGAF